MNACVIQMLPLAHLVRLLIALHVSVNVTHSRSVVRAMSSIAIHVAVFVRMCKNAQLAMFLIQKHANVCVKAVYLRTSGIPDIVNAGKIITRCIAFSRAAASALNTFGVKRKELLTRRPADVCVRHLLVSAQKF